MFIHMPLADGEDVIVHVEYHPHSKSEPFAIAVTTEAVLLLRKKRFAVRDPYFYDRIRLDEMRAIRVKRLRAAWWYVLAVVMILVGGYTTWGMFTDAYHDNGGTVSGWPIAILAGGFALPFVARGRYGLVVVQRDRSFTWKPTFVVGALARNKQDEVLSTIVDAARSVGILVQDERGAAG